MNFGVSQVTRERESGALVSLGDDLKAAATDAHEEVRDVPRRGVAPVRRQADRRPRARRARVCGAAPACTRAAPTPAGARAGQRHAAEPPTASPGRAARATATPRGSITPRQLDAIWKVGQAKGLDPNAVEHMSFRVFNRTPEALTQQEGVRADQGALEPQSPRGLTGRRHHPHRPGRERTLSPRSCLQRRSTMVLPADASAAACQLHADRSIPALPAQVQVHVRGPRDAGLRAGGAGLRLGDPRRGGVVVRAASPRARRRRWTRCRATSRATGTSRRGQKPIRFGERDTKASLLDLARRMLAVLYREREPEHGDRGGRAAVRRAADRPGHRRGARPRAGRHARSARARCRRAGWWSWT